MNSGYQLPNAEWFGDVIVCTGIEADDLINFLAFGCEHEDGHRDFLCAKLFADIVSTQAREHEIQHDDVGFVPGYGFKRFVATIANADLELFAAQNFFQARQNMRVIFDNENPGFHGLECSGKIKPKQLPPPAWAS